MPRLWRLDDWVMGRDRTDRLDNYVAIDIETTGLDPKRDKIIEIGAIKVLEGKVCQEKRGFIDPRQALTPLIQELTGISDEMVAGGPGIEEGWRTGRAFAGDCPSWDTGSFLTTVS